MARFIAGELVKVTHSSPEWLKDVFGRECALKGNRTRGLGTDGNASRIVTWLKLFVTASAFIGSRASAFYGRGLEALKLTVCLPRDVTSTRWICLLSLGRRDLSFALLSSELIQRALCSSLATATGSTSPAQPL